MVNDAYIEHNQTKRQAWLLVPILLVITLIIALFGDSDNIKNSQPTVLESTPEGMLVELPFAKTTEALEWQTQWDPSLSMPRQQVLQSLSEYAADFKQLRTQLQVWAEPGSTERDKLVQRMSNALAQYALGGVVQEANPVFTRPNEGVLLICAAADKELALRILAALTPYLSGKVSIHFATDLTAQSMQLYLFGVPYFNDQGQANFDQVDIEQANAF
jgi:ABC-type uncharacterized transport system fused permease/ATPase subunit